MLRTSIANSVRLVVIACSVAAAVGVSRPTFAANPAQELRARTLATCWNVAKLVRPSDPQVDGISLATLAGSKRSTLRHWMKTCPPPTLIELRGTWRGLNRGIGPAMLGFSQFAKQICTTCESGHGDNIAIRQVAPDAWCSAENWRAITSSDQSLERRGNYVVTLPNGERPDQQAVVFSYGEAGNPLLAPSRFLVDKIVRLSDQYLLGRAMIKLGPAKMTVAYFVLERV